MLSDTRLRASSLRALYALALTGAVWMTCIPGSNLLQAQSAGKAAGLAVSSAGEIAGAVLDPHQARIAGADLQLRNAISDAAYTAVSSADGSFRFVALPAGSYDLQVRAKGFRTSQLRGVQVTPGAVVSQNISLAVGAPEQVVVVNADQEFDTAPLKASTTQDVIGKSIQDSLLNEAQTGSYKAMEMLPSINDQAGDAYGLALGKTLRLRGAFSGDSFLRNIEGLPVSSHGGGGDFIDFENVQSVTVYRGAIPTAKGFGVRNLTGGEDLSILWPRERFAAYVKQGMGGDGFLRTYARVDTGRLASGTAAFVSFSYTQADKWRGSVGGQPKGRYNGEIGLSQSFGNRATLKILGVRHDLKQNDFRSLSYLQATNLGLDSNYYFDYNPALTGVGSADINYYDYTRQTYIDTLLQADFQLLLPHESKLTVKPYYWKDSGYRLMGASKTISGTTYYGYNWMETRPQNIGFTAQYDFKVKKVNLAAGYWLQSMPDSLPPPLAQKFYAFNTGNTAAATFKAWNNLEKVSRRNHDVPYVNANVTLGKTTLNGSLKFVHQTDPSFTYYNATAIGDVSYDAALASNPAVLYSMNRHVWRNWEPSFSISQALSQNLNAYVAYSEGYEMTNFASLLSTYFNATNLAKFQAKGYTVDSLLSGVKPEHYENFDFGARFKNDFLSLSPNFYILLDRNKAVTVYDPTVDVAYTKSNVNASGYGFEAEITARVPQLKYGSLQLYVAPSYNNLHYDNDTQYASPTTTVPPSGVVSSQGKQMADTPQWMTKIAAMYSYNGLSVTPMLRFIGARYGDITNQQYVSSYPLMNLASKYTPVRGALQNMTLSLSATNLFNKRYIGVINTSDFSVLNNATAANSTAASYYPGAPRTLMGGVAFQLDGLFRSLWK